MAARGQSFEDIHSLVKELNHLKYHRKELAWLSTLSLAARLPAPSAPPQSAPSSVPESSTPAGQGSNSQKQPANQHAAPTVKAKSTQRTLHEAFGAKDSGAKDPGSKPSKRSEKKGQYVMYNVVSCLHCLL